MAKTKALISCAVTAQLICAFVFAYAKSRFSHDVAQMKHGRAKNGWRQPKNCLSLITPWNQCRTCIVEIITAECRSRALGQRKCSKNNYARFHTAAIKTAEKIKATYTDQGP